MFNTRISRLVSVWEYCSIWARLRHTRHIFAFIKMPVDRPSAETCLITTGRQDVETAVQTWTKSGIPCCFCMLHFCHTAKCKNNTQNCIHYHQPQGLDFPELTQIPHYWGRAKSPFNMENFNFYNVLVPIAYSQQKLQVDKQSSLTTGLHKVLSKVCALKRRRRETYTSSVWIYHRHR